MRKGNTGLHIWSMSALVAFVQDTFTYPAFSPVRHLLQRQLCSVNGGRLEPYWETEQDYHGPKGEYRESPQ
jgi:hypothetical protein